jgi:nucleoside 2-deoxyribosyltransferase
MKQYIYLAGPITGLTFKGATDWRTYAAELLDSNKIECLTPLRGKDFLLKAGVLHSGTYDGALTTAKAITRRDYFDCTRASAVLINLLGAERVSIGTVMELAWCYQAQIPTVVVMESNNLHNHVMVNESCTYIVNSLEEAIRTMKILLNDVPK